jgi:hypothetical protein
MSVVMSEPGTATGMRRLLRATWRLARRTWHRWCISSNEQWVRACAQDGILDSNSLRAVRDDSARHRVQLAILESER